MQNFIRENIDSFHSMLLWSSYYYMMYFNYLCIEIFKFNMLQNVSQIRYHCTPCQKNKYTYNAFIIFSFFI